MTSDSSSTFISVSACNLNTKFSNRCQSDWSKSNLIAIVTPDGIYILKPQLESQTGPFKLELIRNPTEKFSHAESCNLGPKFNKSWTELTNRQYIEVFSEPTLLTNVENYSLDLYPRRYRLAKWSPLIDHYPRECLLATITIDNQLLVHMRQNDTWIVRADLSKDYDRIWPVINSSKFDPNDHSFEVIREKLLSLSFCNICWREVATGGPLLFAITIKGDIVVWQVKLLSLNYEARNELDLFDVRMVIQTNIEHVSTFSLHENLLFMSARDGQVVLYDLNGIINSLGQSDDDESAVSVKKANGAPLKKTLNLLKIDPTATVWHKDNIEVSDLYIQPLSSETFRLVLTKSTNICWSINSFKKRIDGNSATLSISNSFSAIDGLDPDIVLHQAPATWMRPAGNKKAVLIAEDGSFFQLEFTNEGQDASPEFKTIYTGGINLSYLVPRGLCCSPNGHLIIMISSVSLMYDPAKLPAPTKLILLPIDNDQKFYFDCIQKLLDEDWLLSNDVKSPMDICDRIDYLRSTIRISTYEQFSNFYQTLKNAISSSNKLTSGIHLVKLKIAAFLMMKLMQSDHHKMVDINQVIDLKEEVYDIILSSHIKDVLEPILSRNIPSKKLDNIKGLSIVQINSVRNYYKWMRGNSNKFYVERESLDKYKAIMNRFKTAPNEFCPICRKEIQFESIESGICSNKHQFDRCSRSLLVIDFQTNDEIICEHCSRSYLVNTPWPTQNSWLCLYCQ